MNDVEGKKHHGIRIRSYRLTDFLFDLGLLSSGRGSVSCGGRTTRACRGHLDNISSTITSSKGRLMRWIGFQTERVYQRKWGWLFIGHRGWGLAGPGHRHPIPCGLRWHARASPSAHHPPSTGGLEYVGGWYQEPSGQTSRRPSTAPVLEYATRWVHQGNSD